MSASKQPPKSLAEKLADWGMTLNVVFLFCLFGGGAVVGILKAFFPELGKGGLTPGILAVLIPIWTLGGVGMLLSLSAWILCPDMLPKLAFSFAQEKEGGVFSGRDAAFLIKFLASLVAGLILIVILALWWDPKDQTPPERRVPALYCMTIYCAFTLYLCLGLK